MTMQKTTTKSPHSNILHIRLDEQLREKLQKSADAHRFPLVREIRHRLIDSLDLATEEERQRRIEVNIANMEICWHRYGARHLRIDLADELADEIIKDESVPEKIKNLARLIIQHRAPEQRKLIDLERYIAQPTKPSVQS
jgi:hypothetical protein